MPINNLSTEVISFAGPADTGIIAAVVGDSINLTTSLAVQISPTTTLSRKPAGSAATVASNAFTVDLPGEYDVLIANGGTSRTVRVIAFPVASLGIRTGLGSERTHRGTLQVLAADPRCTLANVTIALETPPIVNGGLNGLLYGSPQGLNFPFVTAVA